MDDSLRGEAVAQARRLLQAFKAEHPGWRNDKTPLDELVAWCGLEVTTFHPEDQPQGTYGWLEPGEALIWLCRGLSETLRRFTLAHELGHAILHRQGEQQFMPVPSHDDPCQVIDVQEQVTGLGDQEQLEEILGVGQSYDPRSQRELAANLFAAELLMPLERVRELYLDRHIPASRLASLFAVSPAAMLNRLAGLLNEQPDEVGSQEDSAPEQQARGEQQPVAKKRYDEFQQAAIEAPTPALIVAGPGSGKTSTLIGRAEYLIRTLGVEPQHILALTFSRKAAQEMQERLQVALEDLHAAPPTVSTFHAFCAELLRTHGELVGLRAGFGFVDDAEGYFLLRHLAGELPLRHYQHLAFPTMYFPDLLQAISRAKDELVTPEQYAHLAQQMLEQAQSEEGTLQAEKSLEVAAIYACYQAELRRRGDTDFGGLIMLSVELLQQHPEVLQEQQQLHQHILVDEFQDMNRASGVLLRLLAGEQRRVWVVGDADQAIYSFRGASPANIANFRNDYPGAAILPLNRNYRSRPDIVNLADAFRKRKLEANTEEPARQVARPTLPGAYVTLATAAGEASELAGLVADIRYKHAECGYSYQDMVVLCRTRAQARKVTQALAQAGLPVLERGGGSLLEQEHIRNVLSIILLLARPGGMGLLRAARQAEHALAQSDIEELLLAAREQKLTPEALIVHGELPSTVSSEARRSLERLAEILQALGRSADMWSLLAQYLLLETSIVRDVLKDAGNVAVHQLLADYAGILQLARAYDRRQQRVSTEQPDIQEQAKGFLDYLSIMLTLRQDSAYRRQAGEDAANEGDHIRVLTVHASKGLEFPVVYLPGLVQRRFPMQARPSRISMPAGLLATGRSDLTQEVHESGEACLFYVGVTRARDHLVLSYSERYGKQKYKPSLYLDALLAGLPAERIIVQRWEKSAASQEGSTGLWAGEPEHVPSISSQPGEQFIKAVEPAILSIPAIEAYQNCPRRYVYTYIYGFQREENAYQLFWQATQKTFEELLARQPQQDDGQDRKAEPFTQEEAEALYLQHWQAAGGRELPFATVYEQHGRAIVKALWPLFAAGKQARSELRRGFVVDVGGAAIRVEVDRVEASTQAGKPVRFVRSRVGKSREKPAAQVRELLYARVYRELYPGQDIEIHHHNLSTGEMLAVKLTEKREQRLYDELEQAMRGLEQHAYPAIPDSFKCPGCPFYLICPA